MKTYLHYLPHTLEHWISLILLSAVLFGILFISIAMRRKLHIAAEYTRKFVHMSVGVALAASTVFIQDLQPVFFIALLFTIINYISIKKGFFDSIHDARESYGTVYYPLVIAIAAVFFWYQHPAIFIATTLVLSLGDAAAAIAGTRSKNPITFRVWRDKKSLQGSSAMFVLSFVIFAAVFWFEDRSQTVGLHPLLAAFSCAVPVTVAETISRKGSDNLSVALSSMLFLWVFSTTGPDIQQRFLAANILAIAFAYLAYYSATLKTDGVIAAYAMAVLIFGSGGLAMAVPILVFFISSSALSRLKKQHKRNTLKQFEKGSRRDAGQVLANGGLATLFAVVYLFYAAETVYHMYLVVLAAANADTWATELGVLSKHKPRLITTWEKAEKGRSGAVSLTGTMAAAAGSVLVVISGMAWLDTISIQIIALLGAAGFAGSLADSLLGATLQAQYRLPNGSITEKATLNGHMLALARGKRFINNDLVNFLAGAFAVLAFMLMAGV